MVSPVGDKFFVEATAGRLFLVCQTCVIPHIWLQVLLPQNRFALCRFYVVQETTKAVQVLFFDTYLFSDLVCISSFHLCTA
jgi:fumarate reductase subunit C